METLPHCDLRTGARRSSRVWQEIIVDNFAGGGGASLGIEWATGRAVDLSVNHDRASVEMHAKNHPATRHFCEDIWSVDPVKATRGRKVGLAWFSPDCRHFSRAKGGKPVSKRVRGLAWIVVKWAKAVKPRLIILENVREFQDWGPLIHQRDTHGKLMHTEHGEPVMMPDKTRKGQTFRRWVSMLRNLGYAVEWRLLDAADYGAPTHRRRLFLIARRDGQPIVWPEPTHGKGRKPYRTAAECIDWSIPCPSIFDRKRPLAPKTLRRIAMGLKRYVLDSTKPFIIHLTHHGERRAHGMDEPMPTVTGANRGEQAIVTPYVVGVGGRAGQSPATGGDAPIGTVTMKNDRAVVTPYLVEVQNGSSGTGHRAVDRPAHTITANPKGGGMALLAPYLTAYHHQKASESRCKPPNQPINTLDTQNRYGIVAPFLCSYFGSPADVGSRADDPLRTVTSRDRFALVQAFLTAHGIDAGNPPTVTIEGQQYVIADIGMRMLTPRELARAQGFPDDYILTGTKSNQVARIGNSVCPIMAKVLVGANYRDSQ